MLKGHAPMLADPRIAYLSQQFGLISCGIDDEELKKLGNLYWYTLEYGAVKEKDQIKGYGAGIGSSISESEVLIYHLCYFSILRHLNIICLFHLFTAIDHTYSRYFNLSICI